MKKLWIPALLLLAGGIGMLLLPYHMQMTGVVLLLLAFALGAEAVAAGRKGKKARAFVRVLTVLASMGVILLMVGMSTISSAGQSDWKDAEKSDYAVVLGAAVQENGTASRIMRNRLDAALEFMQRNPHAKVILSGGQGTDEPMSEAQCMYDTLVSMGADKSRLILEDQSHTTIENLRNSGDLISSLGATKKKVTIITSEFHQRRAAYIAEQLGMETCPVSGRTDRWFYRVNYTLREVFAFAKTIVSFG